MRDLDAGWRPSPGVRLAAPLGGIRTRVDDVTGRHPRPLNDQGVSRPESHPRHLKALLRKLIDRIQIPPPFEDH